MLRSFIAALALSLCTSIVHAQPAPTPGTGTADEAEVAFQLGNQAFLAGQYREAIAHYFVSNRLAPNKNVAFNIGRCYEALGDWVAAYRYFQEHASDSDPRSDTGAASRAALERLGPKVALVEVRSTPPGAAIYVDRKDLGVFGTTPRRLPVAPGRVRVIVEAPGFEPFSSEPIDARVGNVSSIDAKLVALTGTIVLKGGPPGAHASWLVGGQVSVLGDVPGAMTVPAGSHRLRLEAPGFGTKELEVTIGPDEKLVFDVDLAADVGTLLVNGDEPGAIIRLDGAPVGFVPTVLDHVPVGKHHVEIGAEGFDTYTTEVQVARGERREVYAQLSASTEVEAASRARESIAEAPASVSLVTSYEMRMLGLATLGDALVGQRGTYQTNDHAYPTASFRGVGPLGDFGNRVQVQLDGHVLNYLYDGSSSIDSDLLVGLQSLDRIELVRGPGSALYGSGALFGVINLVTPRDFSARRGRVGLSGLGPSTGRLWMDYVTPFADGQGRFWTYNGLRYTQPHDFFSPGRVGDADFPDGVAHGVGEQTAGTSMGAVGWGPFELAWYYQGRDHAAPSAPFGSAYGNPDVQLYDRRAFVEARYDDKVNADTALSVRMALDHSYYEGIYPYDLENADVYVERFYDWAFSAEGRLQYKLNDQLSLLTGLLIEGAGDNRMRGFSRGDDALTLDVSHPILELAAYANVDWTYAAGMSVHGGLRIDGRAVLSGRNNNISGEPGYLGFEGAISPRLAGVWKLRPTTTLKAIAGSAFRAPTFYELTYGDGGTTQLPPDTLDNERIWTTEVEVAERLMPDLVLTVGTYFSSAEDSVTLAGEGTDADPLVYTNRRRPITSMGLEVELVHELRRGMTFGVTYALQRSRLGDIFASDEIENSPTHLVGGRAIIPVVTRALNLVTRMSIESGRRDLAGHWTDSAFIWDLGIAGWLEAIRADYSITVRNLLDWQYDHPVSAEPTDALQRQPGLSLYADLSIRF